MVWETILAGAVTAAGWSFIGYGRKKVREETTFDFFKLFETMIIGAVLGGIAAALGVDLAESKDWIVQAGLIGGAVPVVKKVWSVLKSLYQEFTQ